MGEVVVKFEWKDAGRIQLSFDGKIAFPDLPTDPGVYRLVLTQGDMQFVYIGETDNLRKRAAGYRNAGPSQATNIRLNRDIRAFLASGGTANLIAAATVMINGEPAGIRFDHKSHRRLAESAAWVEAKWHGARVQNL